VAVASAGPYGSLHLIPDNYANIPPLSFFTGRMPFLLPNQQHQSTEGISTAFLFVYALRVGKVSWIEKQ